MKTCKALSIMLLAEITFIAISWNQYEANYKRQEWFEKTIGSKPSMQIVAKENGIEQFLDAYTLSNEPQDRNMLSSEIINRNEDLKEKYSWKKTIFNSAKATQAVVGAYIKKGDTLFIPSYNEQNTQGK